MTQRSIHYVSLGCPKNRVDTEVMLGVSEQSGFVLEDDASKAEVIVVNTCGFIDAAKQESIDTILEMAGHKESGACKRLVVTGCLSQRYAPELAENMPEVDHFLGSSDMLTLERVLKAHDNIAKSCGDAQEVGRMLVGTPANYLIRAADPRVLSGPKHSAYVKIAEGCNRSCAFCAIPSFRGKQRSRPIEDIVAEVERLVSLGTVEINLISQDTISYGRDIEGNGRPTLVKLLHALGDIEGLAWIRVFYLYPEKLSDDLVALFRDHPKVLPYLDMPLQHASDAMLKRMRRGVRAGGQKQVVETLRTKIRNATLRTSFIVGHPGETDADFDELLEFVAWAQFDRVGVFLYSHEESTRSGEMTDLVPAKVAEKRYRALMALQKKISRKKQKAHIGQELDVLIEGESEESEFLLQGRHIGQAPDIDGHVVLTLSPEAAEIDPPRVGSIRKARVTGASDYDLVAEVIAQGAQAQIHTKRRTLPLMPAR